jgi:hypothetical protein
MRFGMMWRIILSMSFGAALVHERKPASSRAKPWLNEATMKEAASTENGIDGSAIHAYEVIVLHLEKSSIVTMHCANFLNRYIRVKISRVARMDPRHWRRSSPALGIQGPAYNGRSIIIACKVTHLNSPTKSPQLQLAPFG